MTIMQEWLFRASYLRMKAKHLDARAEALKLEAERFRNLASSAQYIADEQVTRAPDNLEASIDAEPARFSGPADKPGKDGSI